MRLPEDAKKIVVLRALQLGDLMCAVPALRSLRRSYPTADISLVGLPWARQFVLRFNHLLDRFIEFPGFPGLPERPPLIRRLPPFLRQMQDQRFDAAIQLHGSGSYVNPLTELFGARRCAGYFKTGEYCPDEATFMEYPEGLNEIRRHLELTRFLGLAETGESLEFPISENEKTAFGSLVKEHGLSPYEYICFHPGSRAASRRWAADDFGAVAGKLAQRGLRIVVTGCAEEQRFAEPLLQAAGAACIDLTGKTDLGVLAMLLKTSRLLVCNDTAVSHIAAALRVPSIVLFSGSDLDRWAPLDAGLHRAIRVVPQSAGSREEVLREAETMLEKER